MGYRGRDVEVSLAEGVCLVAACDSSGAIGDKELDRVRVPAYITGRFTTRVAILEVLAAGAEPQIVTAAVCNEPSPTGNEILRGVRDELRQVSLENLPLATSCEKNMATRETGLGITVVGTVEADKLKLGLTKPGDDLFVLGLPKVGPEISSPEDSEIVQTQLIRTLRGVSVVHDIVPVGSKGILGEIRALTEALGLAFFRSRMSASGDGGQPEHDFPGEKPDLDKSGGPATCALITAERNGGLDVIREIRSELHSSVPIMHLGVICGSHATIPIS